LLNLGEKAKALRPESKIIFFGDDEIIRIPDEVVSTIKKHHVVNVVGQLSTTRVEVNPA
jgi:hypothetical protein